MRPLTPSAHTSRTSAAVGPPTPTRARGPTPFKCSSTASAPARVLPVPRPAKMSQQSHAPSGIFWCSRGSQCRLLGLVVGRSESGEKSNKRVPLGNHELGKVGSGLPFKPIGPSCGLKFSAKRGRVLGDEVKQESLDG